MNKEKNLEGISGWLILMAIGLVTAPIRGLLKLIDTCQQLLYSGAWEAMTTQGYEAYNPLWQPYITAELLIYCAVNLLWVYVAYLFFSKSRRFPDWFIGMAIFQIVFIVADAFTMTLVVPNEPAFDSDTYKQFTRALLVIFTWVPYVMVSKRVQETFKR